MTKKPASKETKVQSNSRKSGLDELGEDDLQVVTGGLAVHNPTKPVPPVCLTNS